MGKTIQVYGFPSDVSADAVKVFLESYTGDGTVYALKVRQTNLNSRAFAVVQFTTAHITDFVASMINQRLYYGNSYLKVRDMERDIVPKPKASMHTLEVTAMNMGCQVSNERFFVLWKCNNVLVKFGFLSRKVEFFLRHCNVEYKLEFSFGNIWQIQLRRPRMLNTQFLVIQVLAAPRIYEKSSVSSGNIYEDPALNYFRDTPVDQWVRATDFTTSSFIGQSSAICLELPNSCELPCIREHFHCFKENEGQFFLEAGFSYSCSLDLVPVVVPPLGLQVPYNILFKVNSLIQNGCLAGQTLDTTFFRLVHPQYVAIAHIERALETLYHLKECCYEPVKWLNEQYKRYGKLKNITDSPFVALDYGLVYIRRIQITPSKVYFCGPEAIVSNRVLRHYHELMDNFIRVSFVDEDWEKLRSTDLSPRTPSLGEDAQHTGIYSRILSVLRCGIAIGDKRFDFLAFSSSQLRDNSTWMFASENGITAAGIREWMGDFSHIRNVAKYAARLGQSFGSSTETLTVCRQEIQMIPDIEIEGNGLKFNFSDGIGKISEKFAKEVAAKCATNGSTPSAFQIRYGGFKGVVAVDPTSVVKLSLRDSMSKYTSLNSKLDVLSWSKFQPCFLNRQLITLLSTLGVKDQIFVKKQTEVINQLNMLLTDPVMAHQTLKIMSSREGVNVLKEMLFCGYKPDAEPFLSMMLQAFRASKLLDLRRKTRIFVPNGRSMMGCLDETGTLEYGQVFVQTSRANDKLVHSNCSVSGSELDLYNFIIVGKVLVAKNPCLHPGDVRILQAINVPDLHHLVDCVVFPQKGTRPHPNECSGSDLDGDIYFVSWDPELIPPREIRPMDYTPAPSDLLDHDVYIKDVQEYFANYIVNDSLGIIANAHTAFADREPFMAESEPCIELARLFSIAVDFPKTGVPAVVPPHLHVREYPDFMEKLDKPNYVSNRVIGKLYREVKGIGPEINCIKSFTLDMAKEAYDPDMQIDGYEDYIEEAYHYKGEYDLKLGNLMDYYGINTEAEILSNSIMKFSSSLKKSTTEVIGLAVRSLKEEVRAWFYENVDDDMYAKASAWYHVTYHPEYWGSYNEGMKREHFLSFPWCVYEKLVYIKRKNMERRTIKHHVKRPRLS